jgi:hypothetical protein
VASPIGAIVSFELDGDNGLVRPHVGGRVRFRIQTNRQYREATMKKLRLYLRPFKAAHLSKRPPTRAASLLKTNVSFARPFWSSVFIEAPCWPCLIVLPHRCAARRFLVRIQGLSSEITSNPEGGNRAEFGAAFVFDQQRFGVSAVAPKRALMDTRSR